MPNFTENRPKLEIKSVLWFSAFNKTLETTRQSKSMRERK